MMLRTCFAFTLCLICSLSAFGQATAKSAFLTAPQYVLPLIDHSTRLDMIDYFESGSAKPSKNALGADTRITDMTTDLITLSQGESATVAMAVLPMGKKEVIMVINSVNIPATDSQIRFYSTRWEELKTDKFIKLPSLTDWVGKREAETRLDIENALPFMTVKATYSPDTRSLTLVPTILSMLNKEDRKIVEPYMIPAITYRWTGKNFKK